MEVVVASVRAAVPQVSVLLVGEDGGWGGTEGGRAGAAMLLLSLTLRPDMKLSLLSTSHSVSTPESPPPPVADMSQSVLTRSIVSQSKQIF